MSSPHHIRIGTDEREAAVRALGEHFAKGRLDPDEYEQRVTAAYASRTGGDLEHLFDDLPAPQAPVAQPAEPTTALAAPATKTPDAPFGRDPVTGAAYSDRYQVFAGILQLLLPFGAGRFYTGHTGIAVAQLLLALVGVGVIWAFIDGIVLLTGHPTDPSGRPLRP